MTERRKFSTRSRHLFLALLCLSLSAPSRAESVEGRWILDFDRENGRVQLTMRRTTSHGQWNNSSSYKLEDFRGLTRPSGTASKPAAFEMIRDAGTVRVEGQVDESGGSGRFHFNANPEFETFWKSRGYSSLTTDDAYTFTMHDVGRKFLDDLRSLGYDHVPPSGLVSMRIHGVSIDYVKKMKDRHENVSVDELVNMRINGR